MNSISTTLNHSIHMYKHIITIRHEFILQISHNHLFSKALN